MAERYSLAYYYVSPEDAQKIDAFRKVSGDSEKNLVTQYVRGWIGRNREYYQKLAQFDAQNRGISFPEWGKIVVTHGIEGLPPYKYEVKNIPDNPLKDVVLPSNLIKRNINYILLGRQNLAFLRVGILYDRDNAIGFVSRIIKEHLARNWDTLYASQVEAEESFENWK